MTSEEPKGEQPTADAASKESADRPAFAAGYPADAELDRLLDAFARGDYRAVRAGTSTLKKSDDAALREAARDLESRTEADPLAKAVLLLTALLLAWLFAYWEQHDGKRNVEPDRPAPSRAP